jgi:hypothetical protein
MSILLVFLDCKIDETCTVETGPFSDEELAPRNQLQRLSRGQRALYSGYLKQHGIKVLRVVFLNGKLLTFMDLFQ